LSPFTCPDYHGAYAKIGLNPASAAPRPASSTRCAASTASSTTSPPNPPAPSSGS